MVGGGGGGVGGAERRGCFTPQGPQEPATWQLENLRLTFLLLGSAHAAGEGQMCWGGGQGRPPLAGGGEGRGQTGSPATQERNTRTAKNCPGPLGGECPVGTPLPKGQAGPPGGGL